MNGYLCDTQKELVGALLKVGKIKERDCKKKAQKYTLKEAAKKYQAYFERVWKSISK